MKKLLLMVCLVVFFGCETSHKDYEANKKVAQQWVKAFETSNFDLWKEVVSEDLLDQAPMYGMGQVNYDVSAQVAEFYTNNYRNVKFHNDTWLPGIDTVTMKPDGSVRAYGTWTGESISTGRTFSLDSYHYFTFKDGKIASSGEFFDATGMINAVGPVDRKVVVATLEVKKGKYQEVKDLLDSKDGLPTTRAYEGCSHLEAFFNEETNKFFIIEHWDSFESYQTYLDWRLNEDPSKIAQKVSSHLVGGSNGLVPHTNNIAYKFY